MRQPTARIVDPGGAFWTGHRLRRIHKDQLAVICEECPWYTVIPIRFGYDHAEYLRFTHLAKVHVNAIHAGTMAWQLPREGNPVVTNRPKRAGTAWEVAVRDYLRPRFPYVERLALGGTRDGGDLTGIPGWLVECKVANSRADLGDWLTEATVKANRLGVDPLLVVKRRSQPVGLAFAVTTLRTWVVLEGDEPFGDVDGTG